ncbi:MAG: hypothetical protein VKN56_10920 [Cyanobacteriota bacterium]|nr:hypothetical protein [Cyanobacteriota bacterium]
MAKGPAIANGPATPAAATPKARENHNERKVKPLTLNPSQTKNACPKNKQADIIPVEISPKGTTSESIRAFSMKKIMTHAKIKPIVPPSRVPIVS